MEQEQPRRSDRHDDPDGRPHRGAFLALLVAFLVLVAGVVAAGAYYGHCKGASGPRRDVAFTVAPGTSGEEVVTKLHDLGVVRCGGIVGRILLRGTGKADDDQGRELHPHHQHDARRRDQGAVDAPAGGADRAADDPRGLPADADRRTGAGGAGHPAGPVPDASAQAKDWSLAPYLPAGKGTEGFLFPETYRFAKDATTPNDVIQRLLDQFDTEATGARLGEREGARRVRLRDRRHRLDDRAGGGGGLGSREDRRGHLQPAGHRDAARDRRDHRLHRPGPLERTHRVGLRDRQPVQHAAAHGLAADADREPRDRVAPRCAGPRRRSVPLLRALRRTTAVTGSA